MKPKVASLASDASAGKFPFHYGGEADQYTFYRIPKLLFDDAVLRQLSTDANLTFEECEVINYDDLMEQVEAVAEKEIQQAQASIDAPEMHATEPDFEKREPTISFYVAECGEFHNMDIPSWVWFRCLRKRQSNTTSRAA